MSANVVFSQVLGGVTVLRFNANATINVAANSTANSDLCPTSNEQVTGCHITGMWWTTPNNIKVARGSNTTMTLNGSYSYSRDNGWRGGTEFPGGTIAVTMTDANSTLWMEVTRQYANGSGRVV